MARPGETIDRSLSPPPAPPPPLKAEYQKAYEEHRQATKAADERGEPLAGNSVACLPDGTSALSAGKDQTVRLWGLEGGAARQLEKSPGAALCLAVSADGRWAAVGTGGLIVRHRCSLEVRGGRVGRPRGFVWCG